MKFIEWILRKNFLILLLSIFLFAFSLSYLFRWTLIEVFAAENIDLPKQGIDIIKKEITSNSLVMPYSFDSLVEGNLIRGRAVTVLPDEEELKTTIIEDDPKVISMLVTGTISGNSEFARVTIKEKGLEEAEEHSVGNRLGQYRIFQINQNSIRLGNEKFSFLVEIGETIGDALHRQKPKFEMKSVNQEALAIEHKPFAISRTDIERIMKNPEVLYKNARFGPNLANGKIDGMKLYQVAPSHFFSQMGAMSGDIIKRVNGMPLGETEKMLEVWSAIKTTPKIQVDLDRNGKTHSFLFFVRP